LNQGNEVILSSHLLRLPLRAVALHSAQGILRAGISAAEIFGSHRPPPAAFVLAARTSSEECQRNPGGEDQRAEEEDVVEQ